MERVEGSWMSAEGRLTGAQGKQSRKCGIDNYTPECFSDGGKINGVRSNRRMAIQAPTWEIRAQRVRCALTGDSHRFSGVCLRPSTLIN